MRIFAVLVGMLFGTVAGMAIVLLVAVVLTRNDLWSTMWTGLWFSPIGLICGGAVGGIVGLGLSTQFRERETKRIRWKRIVFSLAVATSALVIMIGALLSIVRYGLTPPSDEKLLANFELHEATFNELIEMLKADQDLIRVDENWTHPEHPETIGVSQARVSAYRKMLREARVPRGFQSEPFMYEIDFLYWIIGSAISSDTTKGYAYRKNPPIEILSSLDGHPLDPKNSDETVKVYRHIRGNWYLFYEYIPG
jgi:MFS family permease